MNRYELKIKKQDLEIKRLKELLRQSQNQLAESVSMLEKGERAIAELGEIIEEMQVKQEGYQLVLERLSAPDDPLISRALSEGH